MKILNLKYSKIIPFDGFYAISLFGNLVRRIQYKDTPVSIKTMNHEGIHVCQAEDFVPKALRKYKFFMILGFIVFYLLYFIEWLIKLIISIFVTCNAYHSISFEQEAYLNENNIDYQDNRKRWAWAKYVFKLWN